jgi:hypothetical protein
MAGSEDGVQKRRDHRVGSGSGDEVMDSMRKRLVALLGSKVNLALDDGTRLDDCELISLSRSRRVRTAWIFRGGNDTFVPENVQQTGALLQAGRTADLC